MTEHLQLWKADAEAMGIPENIQLDATTKQCLLPNRFGCLSCVPIHDTFRLLQAPILNIDPPELLLLMHLEIERHFCDLATQ